MYIKVQSPKSETRSLLAVGLLTTWCLMFCITTMQYDSQNADQQV
jgi:hypothetical protein